MTDSRIKDVLDDILTLVDDGSGGTVPLRYSDAYNKLSSGQGTMSRSFVTSTSAATLSSQALVLTYFTCQVAFTSTQVKVFSGTIAAGATPSLARIGLYSIASDGAGTLVASTASDTALFASTTTAYTKSWSASYALTAGTRYALGLLVVTAAAAPNVAGSAIMGGGVGYGATELAVAPRMAAYYAAQADLPASFTNGALNAYGGRVYGVVLP